MQQPTFLFCFLQKGLAKNTKATKAKSAKGKKYNKMIHAFDYSRYKDAFANACHRQRIGLHLVNPANTSKIGDRKYAKTRKLTVHQAASYVIARRAQGYKDTL